MNNNSFVITEPLVRKLLDVVDAGLTAGLGIPKPGKMCVEAAVSYALGERHSDSPSCVDPIVRAGKMILNDCAWSSSAARASGMRDVAIAQLGSKDVINQIKYARLLAQYTTDEIVPLAAKYTTQSARYAKYAAYAVDYAEYAEYAAEYAARFNAAYAAESAAKSVESAIKYVVYAAKAANRDEDDGPLRLSAQLMVRALRECGSPGCEWLWLCDEVIREKAKERER